MTRKVSDSDSVRRQNRGLVLGALRFQGPLSRTALAANTGLSHASITAITQDLLAQDIIYQLDAPSAADSRSRGRPAVQIGFNRHRAAAALFELDVNRARLSLIDYGGVLVDRIENPITPTTFAQTAPAHYLAQRLQQLQARNPHSIIRRVAISVQGILDREGHGLKWSPIPHIANQAFGQDLATAFAIPVTLHKRGRLLAEGVRWLDPSLAQSSVATVFVGSTIAMGITFRGQIMGRADGGATEFGHMNHTPNGALCRCGTRGCIEAYAADYGILRTAYSVPETAAPAPAVPLSQYEGLIARAEAGDRNATHAFNLAGRAIGYGLSRMLAVFDPSHILIIGPGARALPLLQAEITAALASSLVCRINGMPEIIAHRDEQEPIFKGLLMNTLNDIDQSDFAGMA